MFWNLPAKGTQKTCLKAKVNPIQRGKEDLKERGRENPKGRREGEGQGITVVGGGVNKYLLLFEWERAK